MMYVSCFPGQKYSEYQHNPFQAEQWRQPGQMIIGGASIAQYFYPNVIVKRIYLQYNEK